MDLKEPLRGASRPERTAACVRGAARLLERMGFAWVAELPLRDGRRADLCGIGERGEILIVEVKSCPADLHADRKWRSYRQWCDCFYFAVDPDFPPDLLPEDAGVIVSDGFDGEIVRAAPEHPLSAARRRSLLLDIARTAARRLARACEGSAQPDPFRSQSRISQ